MEMKRTARALYFLPTPRETLCFGCGERRERGIAYLAWFPPPSSVGSPIPFIPWPFGESVGERDFFLFFCRSRLRFPPPGSPPRLKRQLKSVDVWYRHHMEVRMPLIWWCTYIRTESALKLIIVSDTVQRQCLEKTGSIQFGWSQHLPSGRVRACQRGGTVDEEGPSVRGQFPIFGTVSKTDLPPTET